MIENFASDVLDEVEFTDDEAEGETSELQEAADEDDDENSGPEIYLHMSGNSNKSVSFARPNSGPNHQLLPKNSTTTGYRAPLQGTSTASSIESRGRLGTHRPTTSSSSSTVLAPGSLGSSAPRAIDVESEEHLNALGAFNFKTVLCKGDYLSRAMDAVSSKDVLREVPTVQRVKETCEKTGKLGQSRRRALPLCFGDDTGYAVHRVFIRKDPNGIGIRFKVMDGKLVVWGFRSEFDHSLDVKVNDVVIAANHLDAFSQPPAKILEAMRWREPNFSDEAAALPDIMVTVRFARMTRELTIGRCREDLERERKQQLQEYQEAIQKQEEVEKAARVMTTVLKRSERGSSSSSSSSSSSKSSGALASARAARAKRKTPSVGPRTVSTRAGAAGAVAYCAPSRAGRAIEMSGQLDS